MVKEVKMYTVICDNCGADVNGGEEFSAWNDKGFVEEIATEADWIKEGDEHYCPNCFSYDDDDNLVIHFKTKTNDQRTVD